MRLPAVILPILLFVALLIFRNPEPPAEPLAAPPPARSLPLSPHSSLVWISHDWVEFQPAGEGDLSRNRRETFGLDLASDPAACVDPNCRACLIDLVYGQEF